MQEAFDTNEDLGNLWGKDEISRSWFLTRALIFSGMRLEGKTLAEIARRFKVSPCRVRQVLAVLYRRVNRKRTAKDREMMQTYLLCQIANLPVVA